MPTEKLMDRHQLIMPYLIVNDAPRLIDFLIETFSVLEAVTEKRGNRDIMHAENIVDQHTIMVAQANADFTAAGANLLVYVENCDEAYDRGCRAGGKSVMGSIGPRLGAGMCGIQDPTGNIWWTTSML